MEFLLQKKITAIDDEWTLLLSLVILHKYAKKHNNIMTRILERTRNTNNLSVDVEDRCANETNHTGDGGSQHMKTDQQVYR